MCHKKGKRMIMAKIPRGRRGIIAPEHVIIAVAVVTGTERAMWDIPYRQMTKQAFWARDLVFYCLKRYAGLSIEEIRAQYFPSAPLSGIGDGQHHIRLRTTPKLARFDPELYSLLNAVRRTIRTLAAEARAEKAAQKKR